MSGILGALGLTEAAAERAYVSTLGQRLVYDAVQAELARHNADLNAAISMFIGERTTDYKRRYELPGGGYLQPMGTLSRTGSVKAFGSWDVAFPLFDYGAAFSIDRVGRAYMTVAQLNKHLDTIMIQDRNTMRLEILKALFDNGGGAAWSFADPIWGTLSVQPLANGDAVVYPPVLGSDTEATDNHYLESGYTVANISDTNNPFKTIADELEEHFGTPTGGSRIVMLTTPTICDKAEAVLTDFDPVTNRFVVPGSNVDTVTGLPSNMPGRVRGVCNSVWAVEWRWLPANYAIALHLDAPAPLVMREDPADTGLSGGLNLVAEDEEFPFRNSYYSHRFGIGAGNRLNGVVMEFGVGGGYTIPTGYSH